MKDKLVMIVVAVLVVSLGVVSSFAASPGTGIVVSAMAGGVAVLEFMLAA